MRRKITHTILAFCGFWLLLVLQHKIDNNLINIHRYVKNVSFNNEKNWQKHFLILNIMYEIFIFDFQELNILDRSIYYCNYSSDYSS